MWTTVLVLAIAVNFEPTRLGLIALILIRPHPIRQLLAFLCGSFLMSITAGLVVLFLLRKGVQGLSDFNGAKAQIAIGAVALIVAALLASNISSRRLTRRGKAEAARLSDPGAALQTTPVRIAERLSRRGGELIRGSSPWFAAALGFGIALPSVDYIALLLLIATSDEPTTVQTAALFTFVTVANTVVLIPIAGYLAAPARTQASLEKTRDWVLARRRRDYAAILAVAGCLMIAVGAKGL
ncbi:MAG: GAP family protein [Mycobacterium sp.]|jgi:hypothetical protein